MNRIVSSFIFCAVFALQAFAGTTGNVRGVISDADTKEPLGGVTVVATSPALQGETAALSDEQGLYTISNLPPGTYTITAMFAGAVSERTGIVIAVDKTVAANLTISLAASNGEVYTIEEKAPNVDVASSTVGVTVTKDYIENVPMGRDRNFDNAMSALPSAGGDAFGTSVGGATSPENTYVIDGLNTTDPSTGLLGTRMVLEFIDEFDVKEGGYGPEFGRSTGGFVNAVTKGGSNDFHGSVFAYYRPGWLQLASRDVTRAKDSIIRKSNLDYYLSTGFELGGPIVKDLLWFHIGYSPEIQSDNWTRLFTSIRGTDKPALDVNGDPIFEETGTTETFNGFAHTHQYTFKLTHLINNNNRHSISLRGSPTFFDGAVGNPFDPDSPSRSMNGDPSTFRFTQFWSGNLGSAIYNYAGKYFNDKLKLDAFVGVHHQQNHYEPLDPLGNEARITYVHEAKLRDLSSTVPLACQNDFADGSMRCPVTNFSKLGFGSLDDLKLTRFVEKIAFTNLFEVAGLHQLKYGIDFEQILSDKSRTYSGEPGFKGIFQDYITGDKGEGYFKGQQYAVNGVQKDKIEALTGTMNYALFLGDSWNPTPNLILNYGVRWEAQDFFGVKSPSEPRVLEHKFAIADNIAPRAGLVWDFTGQGKGALRFNYGRYFESIPTDLNERAFGGEGLRIAFFDRQDCKDAGGNPIDPLKVTNPAKQCKFQKERILGGEDSIVAPGLKGQYSDELLLSFDYEPFPSWVFGVTGIYRYLGRVIEDMSTDGGETYLFANPGDFDINALEGIRNQMLRTEDRTERERLQKVIELAARINEFPKPVRDNWQLQFKIDKKVSENFLILATYVLSWSMGNYPGLFSANNGQLDPNLTSQYDLPQLLLNRQGYLPQDRRHRFKLSGYYKASLKEFGLSVPLSFTLGSSMRLQSGSPYEVLGADEIYGNDEVFILPRGSGGRTPWTWAVDVNFGTTYNFTDDVSLEIFAAIYNLFNIQDPVAVDDTYTYDTVKPIVGGNQDQLKNARNVDGKPVKVNPNYGNAIAYQAPFGAQIGARLKF